MLLHACAIIVLHIYEYGIGITIPHRLFIIFYVNITTSIYNILMLHECIQNLSFATSKTLSSKINDLIKNLE